MKDVINNHKKSDIWKIQLTLVINFISFKDIDEEFAMHSKSDNNKIMINKRFDLIFDKIDSLCYKCQRQF